MLLPILPRLMISVPLLLVPLTGLAMKPAMASGVAAEEAVRILSKARSADRRCKILSAAERSELSRYTARAEIAAASQVSSRAAKGAAAAGAALGLAVACSPDLDADVRETLDAAREAVAGARPPEPAAAPAKKNRRMAETNAKPRRVTGQGLGLYARAVKAYYLERQCRSLSKPQASAFWKGIVRLHRQAVASNGAAAVAPLMRSAERQAGNSSCGGNVQAVILRGYEETTSR